MKTASLISFVALAALVAADRTFTVKNNCAYTIWPGLFTDPSAGSAAPSQATGWELSVGGTTTFSAPDNWRAGSIWARTDCNFSSTQGASSCATGGCDGGLECTSPPADGSPVTIAEFTLSDAQQVPDNYDVSIVDGFNVPIEVDNSEGCPTSSCPVDLTVNCPAALQFKDASGAVVGCHSDCQVSTDPTNSPACCTGSHSTAATCPASQVPHYGFFKNNCPEAIAFPYDESGSPLVCVNDEIDYAVTFCP